MIIHAPTIGDFLNGFGESLGLRAITPCDASGVLYRSASWLPPADLIGYFNPFHPNYIQLVSAAEQRGVAAPEGVCLIVSESEVIPTLCPSAVPIFGSSLAAEEIIGQVRHGFSRRCLAPQCLHGVMLQVHGRGVLIQGTPGIGKSELALALLGRGHVFVADDLVECVRSAPDEVTACCPSGFDACMALRDAGPVSLRSRFASHQLRAEARLDLIVLLQSGGRDQSPALLADSDDVSIVGRRLPRYRVTMRRDVSALADVLEMIVAQDMAGVWPQQTPVTAAHRGVA